ncbi:hypothetical protein RclHR1_04760007 [Rhizophagus clarus]|uniref:WHIM1 domain-containing protein n=1 Tax=Rhizophagus clarus TaxID=94130 RepID=A0A2Z6S1T5_9GLOM|nr:hypothetical protein RclHR1_04760007 [Rhizophagus clarus]GES90452.1 hypothetical protein GLOIN_2v1826851 [Rhizophagus clarus]
MGAAKIERSISPCSITPSQASPTNPTAGSTTSYYSPSMDMDPKDMPETAFVIAFCVKFRSAINNISFWPEDLDEAICCKEGPNTLIESLHKAFIHNLELKKTRTSWVRRLAKLINDWRERGHDFFTDHNPIERVNYNYYSMSNRDKVMIMQVLVSWQLAESAEIKRIRKEHNEIINDDDVRPLEVEVLGEDTSGSRYYYIGIGVRIYRESMISGRAKWETVSSTVEELKKFIFDYQGIDPNRSDQERILYNKLVTTVLPYLEPLENERKRLREDILHKVERDREIRLKKIEKDHNDAEILLVRTRSQAKQSVYKEVRNTTGYLEIIKNPTDLTIIPVIDDKKVVNTSMDYTNCTIKDPESPTTVQEAVESKNFVKEVMNTITSNENKNFVTIDKVTSPTSRDLLNEVDIKETVESKSSSGDVTVADTLANEDMPDCDDKLPGKSEQSERSKEVATSRHGDNSSSKMNLSSLLTEEVSREAENVEQRSELSKMAISNILSSESSDVVHTDNKYFEINNENNKHVGPMFEQNRNENLVYTTVQESNDREQEIKKLAPVAVVNEQNDKQNERQNERNEEQNEEPYGEQNDEKEGSNTPNDSNDTVRTSWVPVGDKNRKGKTVEVIDDALIEPKTKRAFVPDAETMIKLEWSLNHPVFRLDEEVFGESTDTDLSDCCPDCAMEID